MYRLLAIAKYDDCYVVPTANPDMPRGIAELTGCPVGYDQEIFPAPAPGSTSGRRMLPLEVLR